MIDVTKPKLAKSRSYVLKTSLLEAVLARAEIGSAVSLNYWTPQQDGPVLWAEYWMPNPNVDHRRIYVSAGSLPAGQRADALEQLQAVALPAFGRWAAYLDAQPDASPLLHDKPRFEASYIDGSLSVWQRPRAA